MEILTDIPFDLDVPGLLNRLHIEDDGDYAAIIRDLAESVVPQAKPKVVYDILYVEDKKADSLRIGGIRFQSKVLRVNLDKVERVFAYVVTCGRELDSINTPGGDPLAEYCLDVIKEKALRAAGNYLRSYLKDKYALGQVPGISPGSLPDWQITEQRVLFRLLGDVEGTVGVRLTESCLMVPVKSVSGIIYPTSIRFESCQLCRRENCRERRAVYDPVLAGKYGLNEPQTTA